MRVSVSTNPTWYMVCAAAVTTETTTLRSTQGEHPSCACEHGDLALKNTPCEHPSAPSGARCVPVNMETATLRKTPCEVRGGWRGGWGGGVYLDSN